MDINEKIDRYLELESEIKEHFKYVDQWRDYPINDSRNYWWRIVWHEIWYWVDKPLDIEDPEYSSEIRNVYSSEELTAVEEDTNCDFNVFLSIFDNSKKIEE